MSTACARTWGSKEVGFRTDAAAPGWRPSSRCRASWSARVSRAWRNGRRGRFRSCWWQHRGGSNPFARTNVMSQDNKHSGTRNWVRAVSVQGQAACQVGQWSRACPGSAGRSSPAVGWPVSRARPPAPGRGHARLAGLGLEVAARWSALAGTKAERPPLTRTSGTRSALPDPAPARAFLPGFQPAIGGSAGDRARPGHATSASRPIRIHRPCPDRASHHIFPRTQASGFPCTQASGFPCTQASGFPCTQVSGGAHSPAGEPRWPEVSCSDRYIGN
jgi:hypothetical protein